MARPGRMRVAAVSAMPVAVLLALAWFTGLIFRPDVPASPAIPVEGVEEPPIDLAAIQRTWPQGVNGSIAHARLQGFMGDIAAARIALPPQPAAAVAAAPEPQLDLGTRLAAADRGKGQTATRVCAACHTFEQGGPNRVGPNLWGVVGRRIGSHAGFAYSAALASQSGPWTYEALDRYLTSPARALPGNKMSFPGIRNAQDRANVIAYLGSLSAQPVPYPPKGG